MGRRVTIDHKNVSHRTIAVTAERSEALARASARLGISSHALILRLVDAGTAVINSPK